MRNDHSLTIIFELNYVASSDVVPFERICAQCGFSLMLMLIACLDDDVIHCENGSPTSRAYFNARPSLTSTASVCMCPSEPIGAQFYHCITVATLAEHRNCNIYLNYKLFEKSIK